MIAGDDPTSPRSSNLGRASLCAERQRRILQNFDIRDRQESIEVCYHLFAALSRHIATSAKGGTQPLCFAVLFQRAFVLR